jgi:ectoine hydroxylase-related dioxygenase (phytanoyl-CoA dioxygenase family)
MPLILTKSSSKVSLGDVFVFNGPLLALLAAPNLTNSHRRAILVHYLRADVPRPENRRQHLDAENAAALSAQDRILLGLDDLQVET